MMTANNLLEKLHEKNNQDFIRNILESIATNARYIVGIKLSEQCRELSAGLDENLTLPVPEFSLLYKTYEYTKAELLKVIGAYAVA